MKSPYFGRDAGLGDAPHELLAVAAVADEVGDRDELQAVLGGELPRAAGRRAIVPSSLTTSASTPAGLQPGEAGEVDRGLGVAGALEHAALAVAQREDVARAGRGPRAGSSGRAARARWWRGRPRRCRWWCRARASTDTVNAVRCASVLSATISGSRSSSSRSPSIGMQITPLVWRIMNAIASGVTFSAAMMRSPSFSRSASSTTITSSPRCDRGDRRSRSR